jgi:diacylglycerol kinase (ATP)
MKRAFFILHNPNAGPTARRRYHAVLQLLRVQGASTEIVETSRHGEGMGVTAEAAASGRFDAVVAAGGDGTVHDVATGLLGSSTPLGIIPTGTANVFARELGLPSSPERVAEILLHGKVRRIPLGQVNGRPFLFVVGIGFDAEAVRHFEAEGTRQLGQFGLVGPVAQALLSYRGNTLTVATDQGTKSAEWVIVTRAQHYAGGLLLSREAGLTETQFLVVRFGGHSPLVRLRQLSALACGLIRYDPDVTIEPVDWVRVDGDESTPIQVDGEMLCTLPVDISLHSERLPLLLSSSC